MSSGTLSRILTLLAPKFKIISRLVAYIWRFVAGFLRDYWRMGQILNMFTKKLIKCLIFPYVNL